MNPTHDWHVGTDGQELLIVRYEEDTVGVHLGPEHIDIARESTTLLTSRLLAMIDTVQPGAIAAYRAQHDAQVVRRASVAALRSWAAGVEGQLAATVAEGIDLGEWALGLRSGIQQARDAALELEQEADR